MSKRTRVVLAVLWALSLVAVGRFSASAQQPITEQAVIYSGADIGK
jgi:hypothetical protein